MSNMDVTFHGIPCLKCGRTLRYIKGSKQCVACAVVIAEKCRLKNKKQKVFDYDRKLKRLCYFCMEVKNNKRFGVKGDGGFSSLCKLCKQKKRKLAKHYLEDSYIKSLILANALTLKYEDITDEMVVVTRISELIKRATK